MNYVKYLYPPLWRRLTSKRRHRLLLVFFLFSSGFGLRSAAYSLQPTAFTGCMLAMRPATGKWISQVDPAGYANREYCPGSLIKPFTVMAAVESGARTDMVILCAPSRPETPALRSCWYRPGHGTVDIEKAIANSCDRYFTELALRIKWPQFVDVLVRFGLLVKEKKAFMDAIPEGERLGVMVGLSDKLKLSPVNLLCAFAAIFNGGYLFSGGGAGGLTLSRRVAINEGALKIIAGGMAKSSQFGTASEVSKAFPGREILSKTGTAIFSEGQISDPGRTHGWYIGVTPAGAPRAAMIIFIPTGTGAHDAVPAAIGFWPEIIAHAPL